MQHKFSKLFHLWRISLILKAQYIEEKLRSLERMLLTLTSKKVKQKRCTEIQFECNFNLVSEAFTLYLHVVQTRTLASTHRELAYSV